MKFVGFLPLLVYGWDLDLRFEKASYNVFLEPSEEFTVIVGGTAGTGGQWMHYEPNPDTLIYLGTKYKYLAPEGMTGGPFTNKMIFKAGQNDEVTELRLAYARSWEFDFNLLKTSPDYMWHSNVWNSKLVTVYVNGHIKKIDLTGVNNIQLHRETVQAKVGDLIRVTLKETPSTGFHWSFLGAYNDADSSI